MQSEFSTVQSRKLCVAMFWRRQYIVPSDKTQNVPRFYCLSLLVPEGEAHAARLVGHTALAHDAPILRLVRCA